MVIKNYMAKNFIITFLITLFGFVIYTAGGLKAESLSDAIISLKKDITLATGELKELRKEIAGEKIPLSRKLQKLRKEVVELRKEANVLRSLSRQKDSGFARLKEEVNYLEEEVDFSAAVLTEYRRDMIRRMSSAEEASLGKELNTIDELIRDETSTGSLAALPTLLELVAGRNRRNLGGYVFSGESLDRKGMLLDGRFAQLGPITYFVSDDDSQAGIVGLHLGSANPSIITELEVGPVRELASGKEVPIPIDVTLGEAIKIRESRQNWLDHIRAGGIIMIPILGLGLVCVIIAVGKLFSLGRLRTDIVRILPSIISSLSQGDLAGAKDQARAMGRPAGPVLLEGIEHHRVPREHLEEIMHERILVQIPYLERWLPFLAVAAAAAPLLGLLGTVTGMIHTFDLVTIFGSGKAKLLSGGISEALITTEYGLIIAIPALLVHAYLSRRVRTLINSLDHGAVAFINAVTRFKDNE
jgi:biopolymer transport protein ExbB